MHQKLKKGFAFFHMPQSHIRSSDATLINHCQQLSLLMLCSKAMTDELAYLQKSKISGTFCSAYHQQKLFSLDTNHLRAYQQQPPPNFIFPRGKEVKPSCITTRTPARSIERMIFTCNMQILYQLIACFMKRRALGLVVKIRGSNDENEWTK